MTNDKPIVVQPKGNDAQGRRWKPAVGSETLEFLERVVPEVNRDDVCAKACFILSHGVSPRDEDRHETGLVIGHIQSGKTLSFEAVAALACDNDFQMIIIVAGTSTSLLEQSTRRIQQDLRIDDRSRRYNKWVALKNPELKDSNIQTVQSVLGDWRDSDPLNEHKRSLIITVLKHHQRLSNLTDLLKAIDMRGVPALIIDDEADQASLNTEVSQEEESTTYQRLMALRDALPLHTYLQYTATPQAPLLISIVDLLSPNFVEVLTPGSDYIGGKDFFGDHQNLVRPIPSEDVLTNDNPLSEPPGSLLEALRIFMVGVTASIIQNGDCENRSMLVHPSHLRVSHQEYYNWVSNALEHWQIILDQPRAEPDRQELIGELRAAYADLTTTVEDGLPSFEDLDKKFKFAFRRTNALKVNASDGTTPEVDWKSFSAWILVGGQAMDRGFTVEGLTVTYMPRGVGVGNADTVQQRARFFGYKRSYLGYCRVYLEEGTRQALQAYVEHEEYMRGQLKDFRDSECSLDEWKRVFILARELRPCRHSVLKSGYVRGEFSNKWGEIPHVVLAAGTALDTNRQIARRFLENALFVDDETHPGRTEMQHHKVAADLQLKNVMADLLIPMRTTSSHDSQQVTGLLFQLGQALEKNPNELCTVYQISPAVRRKRNIDALGGVIKLLQGRSPTPPGEQRGEAYPGDRAIKVEDQVTVQIHLLDLLRDGAVVEEECPVLAVWIPPRLAADWVVQDLAEQNA